MLGPFNDYPKRDLMRHCLVSRMNHDCRPNAAYHFDPETAMMEVHAVRPIAAGEEITVSYIRYMIVPPT